MPKMTKAYQLGIITEPIQIALDPKEQKWYPLNSIYSDHNKYMFIMGKGQIKINKWRMETIEPLKELTAEGLKTIKDNYGMNVAMGAVKGWGNNCLFHDSSYGLHYAKCEVVNMAHLGKCYDTFTDTVQSIGDLFVQNLTNNGFTIEGSIDKGWLWHNYKNQDDCGYLIGSIGIYETNWLHPLQYIEHTMSRLAIRILPQFNPMDFDILLEKLFRAKYYTKDYKKSDKMLKKIVSVKDRIEHLTSKVVADKIESIFELQKSLVAP